MKQTNRPMRRVLSGGMLALLLMGVLGTNSDAAAQPAVLAAMHPAQTETETLVPLGRTVGIKLFSDGVLVVGLAEGAVPARQMGLKVGDLITHINGIEVDTIEQVQNLLGASAEESLTVTVLRGEKRLELSGTAARSEDGKSRLGAWIRDSMAGIGTMTFYDPRSDTFAALGHGINDVDTSKLMTLESGSIMYSTVTGVKRGQSGAPGQLNGSFDVQRDMGQLRANTRAGVYGTLTDESLLGSAQPMEVAHRSQVKTGKATILSNIDGEAVEEYAVEILHIYPAVQGELRNMMLKVTDPRLLDKTGGIVQGMSGSPIIQDGKLVGAVTHVLVNDPTRGYGIFIDNMMAAAG